jgi:exonuclease III
MRNNTPQNTETPTNNIITLTQNSTDCMGGSNYNTETCRYNKDIQPKRERAKIRKDGGQFKELCSINQEVQADILCIQEHNLDTTQYHVRTTLQHTAKKYWQRSRFTISSSPLTFSNTWKPGGTAIFSTGSITGRITATGADEWGRWSYHTLQGQQQRQVTIITIYQVVDKFTSNKGHFTIAAQQRSLLIRQGDSHLTPRQAFQRDLRQFLRNIQQPEHDILILGDFNERLGDNLNGTAQLSS